MSTITISASDVNKLRQQTGAGMMDCKKALTETNGDFEAAIDYLRKKGAKVAAKGERINGHGGDSCGVEHDRAQRGGAIEEGDDAGWDVGSRGWRNGGSEADQASRGDRVGAGLDGGYSRFEAADEIERLEEFLVEPVPSGRDFLLHGQRNP